MLPRSVTVTAWDTTPSVIAGARSLPVEHLQRPSSGPQGRIRGGLDATGSRQKMTCIKLDADEVPADAPCCYKRGSGAAEGIKDKGRRLAKEGDESFERLN
jgi:hypothetical protein